ncbi:GNAT family N-acetyltransferase [Streptacidiphilus sp. N1-10]|uniref:GNAT family N-acetyltransferase n=1 Tax=Streptacidiphilus jeojiensis TaxID=3229225 RepID=A0ABV6XZS0_9ACTN
MTAPQLTAPVPAGAAPAPAKAAAPVTEVRTVRDATAFDALADDWDALVDRCAAATPFQSHAWLSSWWRSYGRPGRLRVVTVRRDGVLVGAAPLMLRRRGLPLLSGVGQGLTDFLDVLLDDAHAEQAAAVLARAMAVQLGLRRPWAALDLRELRQGSAAHRIAEHWPGAARRLPDSLCQHLPGVPVEELLSRLPGRTAQRSRVKLRKLEAAGIETRLVPVEDVPRALGELLALHELQWRGRGVTPEHLRPRFAEHLSRSAERMAAAGRAAVRQYRLDGELVACDLTLQVRGLSAIYVYGVHPDLRERVDVAGILFRESLAHAAATGRGELSLLRGDEPYKQRWRPEQARNERLLLGGGPAVALYAAAIGLRAGAVRSLRARAPWLAPLRTRLRELTAR